MNFHDEYQQSIEQPEVFWRKQAEQIKWYEFPETILSQDKHGFYRWFAGGKLNTAYLALDDKEYDKGPILYQEEVPVLEEDTEKQLADLIKDLKSNFK